MLTVRAGTDILPRQRAYPARYPFNCRNRADLRVRRIAYAARRYSLITRRSTLWRCTGVSNGTTAVKIPPRSPRANAHAERFVLTARTEVTDRMLIFGQRHLQTILAEYEAHYNGRRPHRSRQLQPPRPDHPVADLSRKRIQRRPVVLGGLINEYERAA